MADLEDYGALLRSGQAAVPDYATQEAQKQLQSIQVAEARQKLALTQREVADQQGFQTDLTLVLAHPSAQNYSALIAKHPKFAEQVKASWDLLDKGRQTSDLQMMSEVYSAAANGKHDLAAALMKRRIDADKAAGQDTTHDQAIMDALSSGDPVQQKAALGMIGVTTAAITGPEKFEQTLGALTKDKGYTLAPGDVRFDENNQKVAGVDAKPDFLVVPEGGRAIPLNSAATAVGTGGGGGIVATGPAPTNAYDAAIAMGMDPKLLDPRLKTISTGGGGPASGAAGVSTGVSPAAASVASTLTGAGLPAPVVAGFMGNFHAEGGYDGAQGDGGSASGIAQWHSDRAATFERIIGKPVAEATPVEQAQFVAWEMQNPEAAGMTVKQRDAILAAKTPAQAAALIDQHYERSSGKDRQVRMAAADAFAGAGGGTPAPAAQPGGIPGTIYGNPKPTAHIMTSAEVKAAGLDPSKVYQGHPDGTVSSVGDAVGDDSVDGDPNLTGAAYFNTLPKAKQGIVKTIIDGRFPISAKMTSPSVIRLFEDAARVDPTIDASTYQRRVNTQRDFASSGKSGQAITSARTIINHLYNLAQESEKIGGVNWKFGNSVANWVKGQASDPELQGYMATLTPLSNELPKFLSSKAPTIHEISQTREDFSPDKGPDARRKQIGTTMELMQGRFAPLVEAYSQGMNRNADITDLISSITGDKAAAAKLRALQNYAAGGRLDDVGSPQANASAVQIHSAQEWHALKPGTHYIDPTGVPRVKK